MTGSPIVTAAWLEEHLADPQVAIAQIQYEPDEDDYSDGHIPGARWWYWKDLLWHPTDREFASPAVIGDRLGAAGIDESTTLVLHSGRNHYAMHAWWVLHEMLGHPDVRDVRAHLGSPRRLLVDARTPEEFRGERVKPAPGFDHGAERRGHIPGAVNLHGRDLMNPDDQTLRPRAELEGMFRAVGAAPDQVEEVVAYCRLSHRASSVWFVMTQVLGWHHVRVYDGSWTEWGSIVGFPVER
jgi:thiosulfate/3-mercaptopyruvate sulfurtransferase